MNRLIRLCVVSLLLAYAAAASAATYSFTNIIDSTVAAPIGNYLNIGDAAISGNRRTFRLFDWTGTGPTGAFHVESPYAWNLSHLYITGEVTLAAVPEPSGFVIAAAGLVGLAAWGRRRTKSLPIYLRGLVANGALLIGRPTLV